MEMWCPDDIGRDSWDWVGPPAWGRACVNSPEWVGGSSPVKTEPPQIVLWLLMLLLLLYCWCCCCLNVHVWALGLSCETPAALGPPGLHTTAREPKRGHLRAPAPKNTTKKQREEPKEREERMETVATEGKKARNFGLPTLWAPTQMPLSAFSFVPFRTSS